MNELTIDQFRASEQFVVSAGRSSDLLATERFQRQQINIFDPKKEISKCQSKNLILTHDKDGLLLKYKAEINCN